MVRFGQWKTPRGSSGSAHSALAAARALAGVVTVTWLGKATCSCGTRITWLRKISRPVTVAVCWHSAAWVAAALGLTEGDGEGDDDAGDDDALGEAAVAAPVDDAEMLPQPASTIAARAAAHSHTRAQADLVASGRSMSLGRVCPGCRFHLALCSVSRFARYARFDRETSAPFTPGCSHPGGLHAAQFVLQFPDLVAEPRGDLELQLGRCRVHLLGQLADQADQVLACWAALAGLAAPSPGRGRRRRPRARRQSGHRCLAPALLPAGTAEELRGVRVLPGELVQDVRDPLAQRLRVDPAL